MSSDSGFSPWDWVIFAASLVASLGLGIWVALRGRCSKRSIVKNTPEATFQPTSSDSRKSSTASVSCSAAADSSGITSTPSTGAGDVEAGDAQAVANEYLMGGRTLNPVAAALSTMIGAMSSVVVVGNPAEMYAYGTQLWMNVVGIVLGFFFVHGVILKVLFPLKITSVYTYIERRFKSKALRSFTVFTTFIGTFFYLGLVSYSPSLAMATVTGFPVWISIIVMGLICTIYSSWGGVRAVVYTDLLQTVVLMVGIIVIMVAASGDAGGIDEVWRINQEHGRVEFFNVDPDPLQRHSLWLVIIQGYFFALLVFGMGQPQVQRVCSVATWRKAIGSHYLTLALLVALYCLVNYTGVAVYAVYADCDPMATGDIDKPDQILPYYVMDQLSRWPGVPGMFMAALYAGALSSYSSQINAVSAVMWEDFFKSSRWVANMEPRRRPLVNVGVSVITGVAGIVAGLVASNLGGLFQVGSTIMGTIHAPLLGLFILGMTCPFANKIGGTVGFTTSLAFNLWITAGAMLHAIAAPTLPFDDSGCNATQLYSTTMVITTTDPSPISPPDPVFPLYAVSYTLYALFGVSITYVVGAVVSLLAGPWTTREAGEQFVLPSCARLQQHWERRQGKLSNRSGSHSGSGGNISLRSSGAEKRVSVGGSLSHQDSGIGGRGSVTNSKIHLVSSDTEMSEKSRY